MNANVLCLCMLMRDSFLSMLMLMLVILMLILMLICVSELSPCAVSNSQKFKEPYDNSMNNETHVNGHHCTS